VLKSKVSVFIELYCEKHNELKSLVKKLKITKSKLEERNRQLQKLARHDMLTSIRMQANGLCRQTSIA
jgi:hypothetical protein